MFYSNEKKKGSGSEGRGASGEEGRGRTGRREGRESLIRMYCMRRESIFNKRKKGEKKTKGKFPLLYFY